MNIIKITKSATRSKNYESVTVALEVEIDTDNYNEELDTLDNLLEDELNRDYAKMIARQSESTQPTQQNTPMVSQPSLPTNNSKFAPKSPKLPTNKGNNTSSANLSQFDPYKLDYKDKERFIYGGRECQLNILQNGNWVIRDVTYRNSAGYNPIIANVYAEQDHSGATILNVVDK